eukprot:6338512-Amphidinium_carterae.1
MGNRGTSAVLISISIARRMGNCVVTGPEEHPQVQLGLETPLVPLALKGKSESSTALAEPCMFNSLSHTAPWRM